MVFGQKNRSKSLLFQLKIDDVVFDRIVMNFFLYYLTPYQNLLRLNVIFMVRKIGQLLLSGGGEVVATPSTVPLSEFRAKMIGPI